MPGRVSPVRCSTVALATSLAGFCFGQSFIPVSLNEDVRFSYNKVSIPLGKEAVKGKADFWVTNEAVLAVVSDSDQIETTVLIRREGTLLRDYRKGGASSISFYNKSFTPPRIALPFVWAEHPLLGKTVSQEQKGRVSFSYLALDPRDNQNREGDAILDGQERLKNLFWPGKMQPQITMTISGWQKVLDQLLPIRIDQDVQQETESLSVSWTLDPDVPPKINAKELTFEGLLDTWAQGEKSFLPVNDCRVTITSCVGQTYTVNSYPLLMQIGTAGSESLAEPVRRQGFNQTYIIALFGVAGLLVWILLSRKPAAKK